MPTYSYPALLEVEEDVYSCFWDALCGAAIRRAARDGVIPDDVLFAGGEIVDPARRFIAVRALDTANGELVGGELARYRFSIDFSIGRRAEDHGDDGFRPGLIMPPSRRTPRRRDRIHLRRLPPTR